MTNDRKRNFFMLPSGPVKNPVCSYSFIFSDDIKKWYTGYSKKYRKKKDEDGFIINEVKRHSKGRASNL